MIFLRLKFLRWFYELLGDYENWLEIDYKIMVKDKRCWAK